MLRRVIDLLLGVINLLGRTVIGSGVALACIVAHHGAQGGCGHSSVALPHLRAKQAACYRTQDAAPVCMSGKGSQSDCCGKRYGDQSVLQFMFLC